jgi:3',5'-cyclic AMP phosphodiesterase CpdA
MASNAVNKAWPEDEIRFLFRFRDLIANTIEEHYKVFKKKNSVWWGWWKRPTENARMDIWGKLQQQVSVGRPARIGLFHSGEGEVYAAWVSEVIPPTDKDTPPLLPVPKVDSLLVPEYYRKSPYSRAWMRFVQIDKKPISFFNEYSFDEAPQVPNYSKEILNQLKGKVIKTPDELRGMDTTIWSVRKKRQDTDPDKEIILTTGSVPVSISSSAVNVQHDSILHITDPHFAVGQHRGQHVWRLEGETDRKPSLAEAISSALAGKRIGLVVITGDLTFTGAPEEFKAAAQGLNALVGKLDLDANRFVIIPGNHDIQWTKDGKYVEKAPVNAAPEKAMANYRAFYRGFYGHDSDGTLAMGRRFMLPCGLAFEVCGLNSSSLETGKKFLAGMGRIEESSFEAVANALKWKGRSGLALRVLLTHHHLVLTEDLEPASGFYQGFGIAVDAPRILRLAAKHDVQLVLHGHKHRAFMWRSGVYELPEHAQQRWQLGDVSIIGGGSAGSSDTDSHKNYFNLIDASSEGLNLTMYRAENAGSFGAINKWKARFELIGEPARLMLREWVPPS